MSRDMCNMLGCMSLPDSTPQRHAMTIPRMAGPPAWGLGMGITTLCKRSLLHRVLDVNGLFGVWHALLCR
jgi:hypothetical protein